ncbi:MAG: hypothetical protein U0359_20130 [Byssovorax sp.]
MLTMLLGIGLFAARSAALATASSGNIRQATQTRYAAEYAILLAASKLSDGGAQSYLNQAANTAVAKAQNCEAQANLARPTCYKFFYGEIEAELAIQGQHVARSYSFGSPDVESDFSVELTDVSEFSGTLPGMDGRGGNQTPKFYDVALTSNAQIRAGHAAPGAPLTDKSKATSSTERSRAYLQVGPMNLN